MECFKIQHNVRCSEKNRVLKLCIYDFKISKDVNKAYFGDARLWVISLVFQFFQSKWIL